MSENIETAQETYAENADLNRNAKEKNIKIGQLVLRTADYRNKDQRHKFGPLWHGPYRVIQIQRPNAIIRELREDARPFTIHFNKLKIFNEPYVIPLRETTKNPIPEENSEEEETTESLIP